MPFVRVDAYTFNSIQLAETLCRICRGLADDTPFRRPPVYSYDVLVEDKIDNLMIGPRKTDG